MNLLRNKLWKFLCIPLLFYSFTSGLYIPLGPGILSVEPASTPRGTTVSLRIHGYNTHFKHDDPSLNVILKNDNNLLCASDVNVVDSTDMIVEYGLPPDLRTDGQKDMYNLTVYNTEDGRFFLENAFAIERTDSIKGISMRCATGPRVSSVEPTSTKRGSTVSIHIHGYNTHFKHDDPTLNVFLKNDNNVLCASNVNVMNSTDIIAEYRLPPDLRTNNQKDIYNLIIYNKEDDRFFLENAFAIERTDSIKGISMRCTAIIEKGGPEGTTFPNRSILDETIRNLFFHVPMWFTMIFLMLIATIASILYLAKGKEEFDIIASSAAGVGVFFGVLGILTGMLWANFTWGEPWPDDAKLNGVAAGMLIYLAYFVLRGSLNNEQTKARVSAVYSIFAFVIFIVLIKVMPDIQDSLHPGNGGNPAFKKYDLDDTMRPVFYSAAAGFIILGCWLLSLTARYRNLLKIQLEKE